MPTPRLLEPVEKYSVGTNRESILIEGDNLQVLASLKPRYAGQVDVIYIDPPYNLGKDDFRYSDKRFHDPDADDSDAVYVTNEDGGRHTKWLNFMAPRLYMLWQLLHDERGVLFVSINDVEAFRLGMLLNEILGEENWVGTIVWRGNTDNNPTRIAMEHEYILCYAKSKASLPRVGPTWQQKPRRSWWTHSSALSPKPHRSRTLGSSSKPSPSKQGCLGDLYRYRHVDNRGPFAPQRNVHNPGKPGHKYDVPHPVTKKPCTLPFWGWRFSAETMKELLKDDRIIFGKDEKKIPELKVYLRDVEFPLRSVIEMDSRKGSGNHLERLFGTRDVFKNSKPVELMETLLGYSTRKDSLILDAFAGSGTTGEAVMRLNAKDQGRRRFILIEEGQGTDKFCRMLTARSA